MALEEGGAVGDGGTPNGDTLQLTATRYSSAPYRRPVPWCDPGGSAAAEPARLGAEARDAWMRARGAEAGRAFEEARERLARLPWKKKFVRTIETPPWVPPDGA